MTSYTNRGFSNNNNIFISNKVRLIPNYFLYFCPIIHYNDISDTECIINYEHDTLIQYDFNNGFFSWLCIIVLLVCIF